MEASDMIRTVFGFLGILLVLGGAIYGVWSADLPLSAQLVITGMISFFAAVVWDSVN